MVNKLATDQAPRYTLDDQAENRRFFHHLEYSMDGRWEYRSTRVTAADHPDGWEPETPAGWELNVDRWPQYDEERAGWTRVGPGVLLSPGGFAGPQLVAHWRRRR